MIVVGINLSVEHIIEGLGPNINVFLVVRIHSSIHIVGSRAYHVPMMIIEIFESPSLLLIYSIFQIFSVFARDKNIGISSRYGSFAFIWIVISA